MKKINYLIIGIILLATANAFSQSSYLFTFSGKDKVTSVAVPLDSIYIKNETTGEDTTITDTFVMLTLSSGINEKGWYDNTFSIYQNFENVNGVQSSFKVNLPNNSNLIITVYDIAGKAVSNYHGTPGKGIHTFDFELATNGIHIISANNGKEIKTIKVYYHGIANSNEGRITLNGSVYNYNDQVKKTSRDYALTGFDTLRFMAYAKGYKNAIIIDHPDADKDYIFEFEIFYPTMIDARDGQIYKIVDIGSQTWMAENLAYLPSVYPSADGSTASMWYYVYDYQGTDTSIAKGTYIFNTYGVLYNWPAAMDGGSSDTSNPSGVQGVCPSDWHLPSDAEWKQLEMYLGMSQSSADSMDWRGTDEGGQLKAEGTTHWDPNTGATNSSEFTALPGGTRDNMGSFFNITSKAYFWTATETNVTSNVWYRVLISGRSDIYRSAFGKSEGYSVRCVKD